MPCPMRFGPPPRTMTFFRSVGAASHSSSYVEYMYAVRVANSAPQVCGTRVCEVGGNRVGDHRVQIEAVDTRFQAAQSFLQRLLECAPDGHHLAHGFHLRGEPLIRLLRLLEREAQHFGNDVVDG